MKRIIILIVDIFAIIVLGVVNKIGVNDKLTVEGYILNNRRRILFD
jgi:hypothetical protein